MGNEKEFETVSTRTYNLNLSDADVERLAMTAGKYGMTVSQMLENFIGDLVSGTFTNGSDERMYIEQWVNRCQFSHESEKNLITFFCYNYCFGFTFSDLIERLEEIEQCKKFVCRTEDIIMNPGDDWKSIVHHVYNEDRTCFESIPEYNSVDDYLEDKKECLKGYKEDLSLAQSMLDDIHNDFIEYMGDEPFVWDDEVSKALDWYKVNVSDKLD